MLMSVLICGEDQAVDIGIVSPVSDLVSTCDKELSVEHPGIVGVEHETPKMTQFQTVRSLIRQRTVARDRASTSVSCRITPLW